ncbi:hypothetical protein SAMN05444484_10166 [Flavobacterium chilense]|uniref:Uncharacterized protein n=1 Tax=Flavobacterium chilense TaxID=946677 RepID=A0A1M6XAQ5_9FLAO|nr:hypothetical protein SAMN05444484_10166 [Flavobacterium chilense]
MKGKTLKFILNYLQSYLSCGLISMLFLIYLVITDPYFHKLDFKLDEFKTKIELYLFLTFNIPIILSIVFVSFQLFKKSSNNNKIIIGISSFLGILTFIMIDKIIIKIFIYPEYILLGLSVGLILYCIAFIITYRFNNLKNRYQA